MSTPNRLTGVETDWPTPIAEVFDAIEDKQDEEIPPAGDEFCHIESGDGRTYYCGKRASGETTCKMYAGEAVCPTCGLATCPQCAVMSNLNERLVGEL